MKPHSVKYKGLGPTGLILFTLLAFGLCTAGIFFLTTDRNKKLAAVQNPAQSAGFFENNTYVNPLLGWKIDFPQGMTLLDQNQMQDWHQLPEIYGFDAKTENQVNLFLAMGETFSVVVMAWIEPQPQTETLATINQFIDTEQEKLRQAITRKTLFEINWEVTEVMVDGVPFKRMNIKFMQSGDEQKQQDIFTGLINENLLHISLVYYKPSAGSQIMNAIIASEFGH